MPSLPSGFEGKSQEKKTDGILSTKTELQRLNFYGSNEVSHAAMPLKLGDMSKSFFFSLALSDYLDHHLEWLKHAETKPYN